MGDWGEDNPLATCHCATCGHIADHHHKLGACAMCECVRLLFIEQEVMDVVRVRSMERAEAIAEAWGTHAVLRFPWD